jgi:hypothetical protein
VGFENATNERGERTIWLDRAVSGEAAVLVETGESFRELTARRAEDASRSGSLEGEPCAQNDEGHHHLVSGRARE